MFYDSDEEDEDHYMFGGFNGYGEYGFEGFGIDFGDWLDFGGYESDDYYNDYFDDSDDSDYTCHSDQSYDAFYDLCHSPSLFPDTKKFPVECARRLSKIRSALLHPFSEIPPYQSVTEKLEIPIFELLWECLSYVKHAMSVGLGRVAIPGEGSDDVNKGIMKMWNSSVDCISALPGTADAMCNHWFVWCNDLLIEILQSLISFKIPYTAWESIIFHLSSDSTWANKTLLSKIGTISKDEKTQIIERILIRECILRSVDLTRVIYRVLYSRQSDLNVGKIKKKFPLLLNKFTNSMEHYACFLDSTEPSSKCITHSVRNQFPLFISDHSDQVLDLQQDEFNILNMVGASAGCQNGSDHFTMFIADCEDSGEEDSYHLLCIDKDRLDNEQNARFVFVSGALYSQKPPEIFSCKGMVSGIGFEDEKRKTLTVWNIMSDEVPFERQGIFSSDFEKITNLWKKSEPKLILRTGDDVKICGIKKLDKTIKLMFCVAPLQNLEDAELFSSCIIAEYDLDAFSSRFSFLKPNLQFSLFSNAIPLGTHKNMAFVMHFTTNMLCVYDIEQKNDVVISKTSFECGKDWKIQFNYNPDITTCLLYKRNNLQIRELDEDLTLLKELTLDLDHLPQLNLNSFEFQFCDNILYGFLNVQENLNETQSKFASKEAACDFDCDTFLNKRFADAHTVHFLVDLNSDDKEVVYIEFDDNAHECTSIVDSFRDYGSVYVQFCLTGFNKSRELVQLSMGLDVDEVECLDLKISALCPSIDFATVHFYKSFKDMTDSMLPEVEKVLSRHKDEVADREANMKKEKELLEKLRKENEERERKRVAKKTKEDQRRQRKRQQNIKAEKERKAAQVDQPKTSAQGSSRESGKAGKLKEHIANGAVFTSTISAWLPYKHYGFSTVEVDQGKQSVFVHESCIVNSDRSNVRIGSSIQFQLRWTQPHPRPKAINVKLL